MEHERLEFDYRAVVERPVECRISDEDNILVRKVLKIRDAWSTMKMTVKHRRFFLIEDVHITPIWLFYEGRENFVMWALENGYVFGRSLMRADKNKGYSPSNCYWLYRGTR